MSEPGISESGIEVKDGRIEKNSSTPLYLQIQSFLVEQIRSGKLKPGEQVPPEIDIAAQFKVSRMTARKALESLATKGMLTRHKGRGSYVTENPVAYGFSTMLSFSKTLRARGYNVRTKVLFKDVMLPEEDVAKDLGLETNSRIVVVRRLRVIEGRPAAIHTSYLEHRIFAPLLNVDLGTQSLLSAVERILGQRITYTEDSVQAGLVSPEDASLLEIAEGKPILNVRGIAFTQSSKPIRVTKAIYLGSLFKFCVRNTAEHASILKLSSELGEEG